jgi:hypothetical protein
VSYYYNGANQFRNKDPNRISVLNSSRILIVRAFPQEPKHFKSGAKSTTPPTNTIMNCRTVEPMNADIASGKLLQSLLAGTDGLSCQDGMVRRRVKPESAIETAKKQVEQAKRAADLSLDRAKAAPKPHEITNPAFVALFEAHQRDREVLFAAMRALDAARSAAEKG